MNRADQGKPTQDLDKGRGWLERAEAVLEAGEDSSAVEFARAAAAIGRGFVQLAAVGRLDELLLRGLSLQEQDELRRRRAAEEARPHDGEPTPGPGCYPPVDGWDGVSIADDATEADRG